MDIEDLFEDGVLRMTELLDDCLESHACVFVSERENGSNDGIDNVAVGAVLLNYVAQGFDHGCELSVAVRLRNQRITLRNEHIQNF